MIKEEILEALEIALENGSYSQVTITGSRSSFDILAKKAKNILVIKVLSNIEGLSRLKAQELASIAEIMEGIPFVVSERMKNSNLSDGIIYDRYGVSVCNYQTFSQIINEQLHKAHAKRGNYCVDIDGEMLAKQRMILGLTQSILAQMLGISKQSIYRYEQGAAMSLEIYERLVDIIGKDLTRESFDFEQKKSKYTDVENEAVVSKSGLKREVAKEFENIGFKTQITNAPFDIVASKRKRIFSVVTNDWRRIEEKVEILEGITDVLGGYRVCISSRNVKSNTSILSPEELAQIKTAKQLFKLLSD